MKNEDKVIEKFVNAVDKLSKLTDKDRSRLDSVVQLDSKSMNMLKKLLVGPNEQIVRKSEEFTVPEVSLGDKKKTEQYEKEMLKREQKREEIDEKSLKNDIESNKALQELVDTQKESTDAMDEFLKDFDMSQKKETSERKKSESYFSSSFENFIDMFKYIGDTTGISSMISSVQGLVGDVGTLFSKTILAPLKGFSFGALGLSSLFKEKRGSKDTSLLGLEDKEARSADSAETNQAILDKLTGIEENTTKEDEMLKGGSFADVLKKMKSFLPAGLFGKSSGGVSGKMGGMLAKMVGAGLILGGVVWMASDFIDGFKKGGMSQGFSQAMLGETDGQMKSAFKNAGKWALIGAGIGSFVPVVGTIAGGIIGASIGFLMNYIASLVKSDESAGSKIGDFLLGGNGGVLASLFQGAKFAAMGALIGIPFGPVGVIAGGAIGFVVGFLVNFVKQILPDSIKGPLKDFGSWLSSSFSEGWDSMMKEFSWYGENIKKVFNFYVESYKKGFNLIGSYFSWVGNKIYAVAKWFGADEYIDKASELIKGAWTSIKDSFDKIIDWISNIGSNLLDSFLTVMGDYGKSFKKWWNGGEDGENPEPERKPAPEKQKRISEETIVQKYMEQGVPKAEAQKLARKKSRRTASQSGSGVKESPAGASKGFMDIPIPSSGQENGSEMTSEKKREELNDSYLSYFESIATSVEDNHKFFKTKFFVRIESFLTKEVQKLIDSLMLMNEQNRMWQYAFDTGSLKGYATDVKEFSIELERLEKGKAEGYRDLGKAFNQMNQNFQNVTNNVLKAEKPFSLR